MNCDEQALQSGQLPADLKIGDNDAMTNNETAKKDKMVTDGDTESSDDSGDSEPEENNNEAADMEQEQVFIIFYKIYLSIFPILFRLVSGIMLLWYCRQNRLHYAELSHLDNYVQ